MINIVIWGIGRRAKRLVAQNYFEKCHIIGFIDTYKADTSFMGIPVYRPEYLTELMKNADYLFVAIQSQWEIYEKCIQMGINLTHVIFSENIKQPVFYDNMDVIKNNFPKLYYDMRKVQYALVRLNERDSFDSDRLVGTEKFCDKGYCEDYFRYRTFEFIAEELIASNTKGAVAELGVFRGVFSRLINKKFSNKTLYLFDTFEGFDVNEAEKELELGRCDRQFVEGHKDTSIEIVKENLIYPEQCVICQGFFPQSVTKEAENESYCFVSIDVDFEDSIYAGIEFFYPRLAEGGILYIHDYNTCFLEGVKNAVRRYEEKYEIRLKKLPLADRAGTLVVIK